MAFTSTSKTFNYIRKSKSYAMSVKEQLEEKGVRVEIDDSDEK